MQCVLILGVYTGNYVSAREVCRPNGEDNRCNAQNMTYASVSELWSVLGKKNHRVSGIVVHVY